MGNVVKEVVKGSIADEMGVEAGDKLLYINGNKIIDVFDYRYLIADEYLEVSVEKASGEQWVLEIEKEEYEDLGIVFESGLMDKAKSCANKCIFCFIDQLPKNMRETLYFKDDDLRLSFLQGNYVTMTNMKDEDIDRIVFYHLSPVNVSVHTTDAALRRTMIKNKNSDKLLLYLKRFSEANIDMNFQIVLCKGINDKKHLDKTISDLTGFIPRGKSLSVVPVGLTRYRDRLYKLEPFKREDAIDVLELVNKWQNICLLKFGTRFVYAADELYIKAGCQFPGFDEYEDFPQIENGVGMISLTRHEFEEELDSLEGDSLRRKFSIATGIAAFSFISELVKKIEDKFLKTKIYVYPIYNDFFGESITVSGLLTGTDITEQLRDKELGDVLYIPQNCIRSDDTVLLDDLSIRDIEEILNVRVKSVSPDGERWVSQMLNINPQ